MKKVSIKRMDFLNFKGFRERTVDFDGRTNLSGRNGSGKTTVFDGFTWVLFGKDSNGRTEFDVKTMDGGVAVPKLPHEVTVVLDVDGEEVTLTRRLKEVWRRDRDSGGAEVFKGNETERLYNGVPCSVKEWQERVDAIVKEDIFKYITDPHYFSEQKPDIQRRLLFSMACGVPDADIIASNAAFADLFAQIGGKTLVQFEKEAKSDLARVQKSLVELPARIDERRRDAVAQEDWDALESEVSAKADELKGVDAAIADAAKAVSAASEARLALAQQFSNAKIAKANCKAEIEADARNAYYARKQEKETLAADVKRTEKRIEQYGLGMAIIADAAEKCRKEKDDLLKEYHSIAADWLTFDEAAFVCPTCGRELDAVDVEAKKIEMRERFNADKSRRLEENKQKGLALKAKIECYEAKIAELEKGKASEELILQQQKAELDAFGEVLEPDYAAIVHADEEYNTMCDLVQNIEAELEAMPMAATDEALRNRKYALSAELDALKARLAKKGQAQDNAKRVMELEAEQARLGNEEARLKGVLYTIKEFSKARSAAVSDKINALFGIVKFRLFETQVNGDVAEVCEATMNGVPWSVLSNGEKIVAGLDIIRSIQRHVGVSAPIFIDNAESVTDYPKDLFPDVGQMVFLYAVKGMDFTVTHGEAGKE